MSGGYSHSSMGNSGFDSRAAEAAFASAGNGIPSTGASNGYGNAYGQMDSAADPFAFLATGLGGLSMSDDARRNGANTNKSPS